MKTALIIFAAVIIGFSLVSVTHAVNISLTFPSSGGGSNPCSSPTSTNCSPGNFINYFYQFALMIGGLLAFGVIVYGGVRYATSAGNPSGQHEAKEWVQGALLGLVLLAGAYLILYTVNPNLVQLGLPTLQKLTISAPPSNNNSSGACGPNYGSCSNGQTCQQGTNQVWACATTGGGQSTNTNPACNGVTAGCTIWTLNQPPAATCQGYGTKWNSCTNGAPPSGQQCFTTTQC